MGFEGFFFSGAARPPVVDSASFIHCILEIWVKKRFVFWKIYTVFEQKKKKKSRKAERFFLIFLFSLLFLSLPLPPGGQWAVIDTNYPRFALTTSAAALPTSTVQHSSIHHGHHHHHQSGQQTNEGQGGGNDNLSLSSNHSSSHGSSSNSNSNNNTTIQSQTPVQLQYQTTYSPQIIAVNPNNIVNSYPPSTPTSPIVQSVYSQQSTPIQSPVNIQNSNNDSGTSSTNRVTNTTAAATPAPPKRKRSVNPQGEENFLRALDAVRFGNIGFCKG